MIVCMLAKILPSLTGIWLAARFHGERPLLEAFVIGVLPIWLEVSATLLTKVEPSRVQSRPLLRADAIVDASTFLFVPVIWYWRLDPTPGVFTSIALCAFLISGLWRIGRFLKTGLTAQGEFVGLPVTYTGYVWPVLAVLNEGGWRNASAIFLLPLAWAMVSKRIRIRTVG